MGVIERLRRWIQVWSGMSLWVRTSVAAGWAGFIWWNSSGVRITGGLVKAPYLGNLLHAPVFGVLAGLIMMCLAGSAFRRAGLAVIGAVIWGVIDEVHQGYVPGRHADPWDALTDAFGAGLFVGLLAWVQSGDARGLRVALLFFLGVLISAALATWC